MNNAQTYTKKMSVFKQTSLLLFRLVLVSISMMIGYMVSTMVVGQADMTMTPEEASQAGQALFLVSAINALVLSYPISRSRWYGAKLIGTVFLVQFGVETFMTQIETLYFNRALQLDSTELLGLVEAGAIRAAIFALLSVIIFGKLKKSAQREGRRAETPLRAWILRFAVLAVLYIVIYFAFGYFVAWQWEETRLFYSGTTAILPFLTHFRGFFSSQPDIIPFQLLRGALWAALALAIVRMINAKRWEASLAVALLFAGLLSSGIGLFPNPYMPDMVRQSHFFELLSSMLLYGGIAGWVLAGKTGGQR
jgi:hypothetical protein